VTDLSTPLPDPALDPELATWLERSEAIAFAPELYGASAALPGDPVGARFAPIGDGYAAALTAIDAVFFNRAVGIGTLRPLTEDDVEAATRFFVDLGRTQWLFHLAPATVTPEVAGWLTARGYQQGRRWVKLWHDLADLPRPSTSLRIERIDRSRAADFARIAVETLELPPIVEPSVTSTLGRPGWTHYVGFDGETPVSVAAMCVIEDVAWLGFGGTLEAARGRGGQSAMFATRLADARAQGCRWAVTETGEETEEFPVNHSYRNMVRSGFRLAYARRNWYRMA
jgi:hypothetical protein